MPIGDSTGATTSSSYSQSCGLRGSIRAMWWTSFTTGSRTLTNSCIAALALRKTAGCVGVPLESRLEPSYLWRLCYSYDPSLADRHSIGGRRTGMGGRPLEPLGGPLDFVDRGERGFFDRAYGLDSYRRPRRSSSADSVAARIGLEMDPFLRHPFPSRIGWPEPAAAHAHVPSRHNVSAGVLERDPGSGRFLPPQPALGVGWNRRRVPGDGSVLVLLRMGTDARSHVFPNRDLGSRAASIRGGEVLPFYAAQRAIDADRDPSSLFCSSQCNWRFYV